MSTAPSRRKLHGKMVQSELRMSFLMHSSKKDEIKNLFFLSPTLPLFIASLRKATVRVTLKRRKQHSIGGGGRGHILCCLGGKVGNFLNNSVGVFSGANSNHNAKYGK